MTTNTSKLELQNENLQVKQTDSLLYRKLCIIAISFITIFAVTCFNKCLLNDESKRSSFILPNEEGEEKYTYDELDNSDNYFSYRQKVHPRPQVYKRVFDSHLPPFHYNLTPTDAIWLPVGNTKYEFLVYSAFFDNRENKRLIRIIGIGETYRPGEIYCRFWYSTQSGNSTRYTSKISTAKVRAIQEHCGKQYSAYFILCPLQPKQTVPFAVSVLSNIYLRPKNMLTVNNNFKGNSSVSSKYGVCVKPLHYNYNKVFQLLEFVELNRILGIDHFTFYNMSIGTQANCILRKYMMEGLVTVLSWQLNELLQDKLKTMGMFATLNDCIYRSMNKFSHVLLSDMDEFVIPKWTTNLPQLIDLINEQIKIERNVGIALYSFRNAFFYLEWENNKDVLLKKHPFALNLMSLAKTRRKVELNVHRNRSKYICRPEMVIEAGNHFLWRHVTGVIAVDVPSECGLLHHYRACEYGGNDCIKTPSTLDEQSSFYSERLINSVTTRYEMVHQC